MSVKSIIYDNSNVCKKNLKLSRNYSAKSPQFGHDMTASHLDLLIIQPQPEIADRSHLKEIILWEFSCSHQLSHGGTSQPQGRHIAP